MFSTGCFFLFSLNNLFSSTPFLLLVSFVPEHKQKEQSKSKQNLHVHSLSFCCNPLPDQQLPPGTVVMLCDFNILKKTRLTPLLLLVPHQKVYQSKQREEMRASGRGDVEWGKRCQGTVCSFSDGQPVVFLSCKKEEALITYSVILMTNCILSGCNSSVIIQDRQYTMAWWIFLGT